MHNYLPLKGKSTELGDEYYRCLSEILTRPPGGRDFKDCLRIGRRYRKALRAQLRDLERLPDKNFVRRESELIDKYLNLVDDDLNSLSQGEIEKLLRRRRRRLDQ
jgi:hypothetical protein